MPRPNEREFLQKVLRNDGPAILFCETLFRISQTLDDWFDRDVPVSQERMYSAFWESLIELPANPFYRANESFLRPLMAMALQDWRDSFLLETLGTYHGRTLAFVLRDSLTGLVVQCAGIIGGAYWMQQMAPEIRLHFHEDTLEDYQAGLPNPVEPALVGELRGQVEALDLEIREAAEFQDSYADQPLDAGEASEAPGADQEPADKKPDLQP